MKQAILSAIALLFLLLSELSQAQSPRKLFILLGQSNMAGRAPIEPQDTQSLPLVKLLDDNVGFVTARNPLNIYSNIRKGASFQRLGPGYSFAKSVSQQLCDTIFLVVNARGGEPVERFLKGDTSGYYMQTIARIKQALTAHSDLKPEAILWHQGESNSDSYATYLEHIKKLVEDYRHDLNLPNLPFIAADVGKWNSDYVNISKQIELIPSTIPNSYKVSSQGLTNCDTYHFDAASQRELGERYAQKYFDIIKQKKLSVTPN